MSHYLYSNYGYDEREAEIREQEQLDQYDKMLRLRYSSAKKGFPRKITGSISTVENMIDTDIRVAEDYSSINPDNLRAVIGWTGEPSHYTDSMVSSMSKAYIKNCAWSKVCSALIDCEKEISAQFRSLERSEKEALKISRIVDPGLSGEWTKRRSNIESSITAKLSELNESGRRFRNRGDVNTTRIMNDIKNLTLATATEVNTYATQVSCYSERLKKMLDEWNGKKCRTALANYRLVCEKNNANPMFAYKKILDWAAKYPKSGNELTLCISCGEDSLKEDSVIYHLLWLAETTGSFKKSSKVKITISDMPNVVIVNHKLNETAKGLVILLAFLRNRLDIASKMVTTKYPVKHVITVYVKVSVGIAQAWTSRQNYKALNDGIYTMYERYSDICSVLHAEYIAYQDDISSRMKTIDGYNENISSLSNMARKCYVGMQTEVKRKEREISEARRAEQRERELKEYRERMAREREEARIERERRERERLEQRVEYHTSIYNSTRQRFDTKVDYVECALHVIHDMTTFTGSNGKTIIGLRRSNLSYWPFFCWIITVASVRISNVMITPGNFAISLDDDPSHMYAVMACIMEYNHNLMSNGMNLRIHWKDDVTSISDVDDILHRLYDLFLESSN